MHIIDLVDAGLVLPLTGSVVEGEMPSSLSASTSSCVKWSSVTFWLVSDRNPTHTRVNNINKNKTPDQSTFLAHVAKWPKGLNEAGRAQALELIHLSPPPQPPLISASIGSMLVGLVVLGWLKAWPATQPLAPENPVLTLL